MAKRTRGTTRPGQRRPAQRPAGRPVAAAPVRPANTLTAAEEARAAELEAELVAEERAAEQARSRGRDRTRVASDGIRARATQGGLLAARASEEYTYVVRDVRRIVRVGGSMLAFMAVLYIVLEVAKL